MAAQATVISRRLSGRSFSGGGGRAPPPAQFSWGSSSVGAGVESASNEKHLSAPDLALNLEICDAISAQPGAVKEVVKAVRKRLGHKSPKVQALTLALLEMVMKNCGSAVHIQVAESGIPHDIAKMAKKKSCAAEVRQKILELLDAWQLAFGGSGGQPPQYRAAYNELLASGAVFPERGAEAPLHTPQRHSPAQGAFSFSGLPSEAAAPASGAGPPSSPNHVHAFEYGTVPFPPTTAYMPTPGQQPGQGVPRARSGRSRRDAAGGGAAGAEHEPPRMSEADLANAQSTVELLKQMLEARASALMGKGVSQDSEEELMDDLVAQCRAIQEQLSATLATSSEEAFLMQGIELSEEVQSALDRHLAISVSLGDAPPRPAAPAGESSPLISLDSGPVGGAPPAPAAFPPPTAFPAVALAPAPAPGPVPAGAVAPGGAAPAPRADSAFAMAASLGLRVPGQPSAPLPASAPRPSPPASFPAAAQASSLVPVPVPAARAPAPTTHTVPVTSPAPAAPASASLAAASKPAPASAAPMALTPTPAEASGPGSAPAPVPPATGAAHVPASSSSPSAGVVERGPPSAPKVPGLSVALEKAPALGTPSMADTVDAAVSAQAATGQDPEPASKPAAFTTKHASASAPAPCPEGASAVQVPSPAEAAPPGAPSPTPTPAAAAAAAAAAGGTTRPPSAASMIPSGVRPLPSSPPPIAPSAPAAAPVPPSASPPHLSSLESSPSAPEVVHPWEAVAGATPPSKELPVASTSGLSSPAAAAPGGSRSPESSLPKRPTSQRDQVSLQHQKADLSEVRQELFAEPGTQGPRPSSAAAEASSAGGAATVGPVSVGAATGSLAAAAEHLSPGQVLAEAPTTKVPVDVGRPSADAAPLSTPVQATTSWASAAKSPAASPVPWGLLASPGPGSPAPWSVGKTNGLHTPLAMRASPATPFSAGSTFSPAPLHLLAPPATPHGATPKGGSLSSLRNLPATPQTSKPLALPWPKSASVSVPSSPAPPLGTLLLLEPELPRGDVAAAKLNSKQQALLFGAGVSRASFSPSHSHTSTGTPPSAPLSPMPPPSPHVQLALPPPWHGQLPGARPALGVQHSQSMQWPYHAADVALPTSLSMSSSGYSQQALQYQQQPQMVALYEQQKMLQQQQPSSQLHHQMQHHQLHQPALWQPQNAMPAHATNWQVKF